MKEILVKINIDSVEHNLLIWVRFSFRKLLETRQTCRNKEETIENRVWLRLSIILLTRCQNTVFSYIIIIFLCFCAICFSVLNFRWFLFTFIRAFSAELEMQVNLFPMSRFSDFFIKRKKPHRSIYHTEFNKYVKFQNNLLQTRENIRPQSRKFLQRRQCPPGLTDISMETLGSTFSRFCNRILWNVAFMWNLA